MTIEEKMRQMLVENGLFEQDCDAVMEIVKGYKGNEPMRTVWSRSADSYPKQLLAAVWFSVKRAAVEWIDANCPLAWYRPMFAEKET